MIEQFDKQLRDHIKDTFDVYDDLMEHDGWVKYQRKVNRKKYRAIFWWSFPGSVAAAIALVWLLNIDSFKDINNKTDIAVKKPLIGLSKDLAKPETIDSVIGQEVKKNQNQSTNSKNLAKRTTVNSAKPYLADINRLNQSNHSEENSEKFINIDDKNTSGSIIIDKKEELKNNDLTVDLPKQQELANAISETKNSIKEDKAFNNNFSDLAGSAAANLSVEQKKDKLSPKKFKLGLDASTFMNFTKDGMNQDMNLGVGLASELKISKNFSISSGININKQSASYMASNANDSAEFRDASPFSSFTAKATPVVNQESLSAKFVGFDIPLAIKYSSNNKNLNWFVSTGFSSYTLLTETYSNNISVVNYGFNGVQTTNEVIVEEHKDDPFSNLQLARTLNFSVGVTFPIKSVTSLSVEPFIKYPLRSFGKEDLTIGSSGVSLKMNLDKRLFK